jgi:hypothetical protein
MTDPAHERIANPYAPPRAASAGCNHAESPWLGESIKILAVFGCSLVGAVGYGAFGMLVEKQLQPVTVAANGPTPAYGQYYVLVLMPLSGLIGAVWGAGLGLTFFRLHPLLVNLGLGCGAISSMGVILVALGQVRTYGVHVSDEFTHLPLVVASAGFLAFAAGLFRSRCRASQ